LTSFTLEERLLADLLEALIGRLVGLELVSHSWDRIMECRTNVKRIPGQCLG
jgi:hypothetical protein